MIRSVRHELPLSLFQTVSELIFSETQRTKGHEENHDCYAPGPLKDPYSTTRTFRPTAACSAPRSSVLSPRKSGPPLRGWRGRGRLRLHHAARPYSYPTGSSCLPLSSSRGCSLPEPR